MTESKPVYVLYGSQTGNAESIATAFSSTLLDEHGIKTVCEPLNAMKKVALQDLCSCVLIVCSTTGNGDAPENADAYWRSIKLRSAPKEMYVGVKYAVLGTTLNIKHFSIICNM